MKISAINYEAGQPDIFHVNDERSLNAAYLYALDAYYGEGQIDIIEPPEYDITYHNVKFTSNSCVLVNGEEV